MLRIARVGSVRAGLPRTGVNTVFQSFVAVTPEEYRAAGPGLGSDRRLTWAIVLAGVVLVAIQVGLAVGGVTPVLDGGLFDTDDYLRLTRVENLWQSGAWFDPVIRRIGPPDGLALHWTRPIDVLLIIGAALASPALGFHAALFWWGALISPVLQILSLVILIWAAAPFLSRAWSPLIAFLFIAQLELLARFLVGRPDHHSLLIFLFVLSLGLNLRVLANPARKWTAVLAGLTGALAIWVSVESFVAVAVVIAALGLIWLLGERRLARALALHATALGGGGIVALLVERGPDALSALEIDKISGLHITLLALNAGVWWAMHVIEARDGFSGSPLRRAALAGGAVAVSLLFVRFFFPYVFDNPMGSGGDIYLARFLTKVPEIQPLLVLSDLQGDDRAWAISRTILRLGIAIPVVPWLIYRLWTSRGIARQQWLLFALGAAVFVPLSFYQIRWSSYAEVLLILPYADLAAVMVRRLTALFPAPIVGVIRPFLFIAVCIWVFIPGAFVESSANDRSIAESKRKRCPINVLSQTLNDPSGLGRNPKTVLAVINFGSEILYRTRHSVLAIPNHRPQPGLAASHQIMTATDYADSRQLLADNRVDLVAICLGPPESWFYDTGQSGRTLYQALSEGAPPAFLTPVPLPIEAGGFRLFTVRLES